MVFHHFCRTVVALSWPGALSEGPKPILGFILYDPKERGRDQASTCASTLLFLSLHLTTPTPAPPPSPSSSSSLPLSLTLTLGVPPTPSSTPPPPCPHPCPRPDPHPQPKPPPHPYLYRCLNLPLGSSNTAHFSFSSQCGRKSPSALYPDVPSSWFIAGSSGDPWRS